MIQVLRRFLPELRQSYPSGTTSTGDNNGVPEGIRPFSTDADSVEYHDLTDGAGHGVLIATDNIFLNVQVTNAAFNNVTADAISATFNCDILYRFKEVKLQEYIGIVQSQQ